MKNFSTNVNLSLYNNLPSALHGWDKLLQNAKNKKIIILLDYDGTLTPLVTQPQLAILPRDKKNQLEQLSQQYITTIVTGRSLPEIKNLVNIKNINYIGNHGYEICTTSPYNYTFQKGEEFIPEINEAYSKLVCNVGKLNGVLIENKKYSLSVHFRLVKKPFIKHIENTVDEIVSSSLWLRKFYSKKVFEIRPNMDWDKGHAIRWLTQTLDLKKENIFLIYIGDDVTDEPAFESVQHRGCGILVSKYYRPTAATYCLSDITEVWELLTMFLER